VGSRKTLILVAAIAIGAIGAFVLWGWLSGVQNRADNNAATVDAWVVKSQVDPGKYGEEAQAYIKREKIPRKIVPANAVRDLTQIQGKVTVTKLVPNQVVTTDMFVSPAVAQASFADRLGKENGVDMVTYTMSIDPTHGVAGLLSPGDYVNIMTLKVTEYGADGKPIGVPEGVDPEKVIFGSQARYIYQKAQIVAIDQRPKLQAGEQSTTAGTGTDATATTTAPAAASQGLVTLRVPAKAAQVMASMPPENLYLSLVGKDYKPVPQGPIEGNTLPAENPAVLTPYGPDGAKVDK
jgi:Flp pilus assembly protein CpaB